MNKGRIVKKYLIGVEPAWIHCLNLVVTTVFSSTFPIDVFYIEMTGTKFTS